MWRDYLGFRVTEFEKLRKPEAKLGKLHNTASHKLPSSAIIDLNLIISVSTTNLTELIDSDCITLHYQFIIYFPSYVTGQYVPFCWQIAMKIAYCIFLNVILFLSFQCSYYPPCKSSHAENQESVRQYASQFATPRLNYSCFYNPGDPTEVIREKRFQLHQVVHGMLWSSVIFSVSLGLLSVVVKRRGCEFL